jgi:NADH-quinone oxidoreductase subunit L
MFLGAGSVMHGMNDQVNMRRYGALRTVMVATWITFGAGYLAIMGIPPFAGFFSKDDIIEAAFSRGFLVGLVTIVGAGVTAFYMSRLFVMTFHSQKRWTDDVHPHESPMIMIVPIAILALLSAIGGLVLNWNNAIVSWLEPVTGFQEPELAVSKLGMEGISLVVVLAGATLGWLLYDRRPVPETAPAGSLLTRAARADLYGDAVNEAVFMRPGQYLTRWLVWFDNRVVDGAVNGVAATIGGLSGRARRLQTGFTRSYALSMLGGAALVAIALVLVRL